jgi:HD-GYP domain-containing protein (c-di-GMP phosphodiesterase class II)
MASDDPDIQRAARDIINQLTAILRTAQIHDPSNVAVISAIDKLIPLINSHTSDGSVLTIELVGDYFYVNDERIKFAMEAIVNFDLLMQEFKKHKLGSIAFTGALDPKDVQVFLKEYIASGFAEDPFMTLEAGMTEVATIKVGVLRKIKEETSETDVRKTVKNTYYNAVSFTRGVMNKIRAGEKVNVKMAKRVVQSMVDMLLMDEELMLGMTAIKDYDDYTYHHSVNVSILSISLGQKLGFTKNALLELGLVALFHDLGKKDIPPEILNKPGAFSEDEWKIMKKHPVWGVRAILLMKGFDLISIRAAIVTFEHHISLDNKGYPVRRQSLPLDLYSRIVSLSDQYDGMTSSRVYSRTPMPPEKALSLMMKRTGNVLDPLLFKFFVNMVGVYPVGTVTLLDTRELGIVYGNNLMFPERPKVLVITDASGNKVESFLSDLTEKSDERTFKRSIVKTMDPHRFKINLADYML